MSGRFVRFTPSIGGADILVNVDHVADVASFDDTRSILYQDFCIGDDGPHKQAELLVMGTLDEVQALLNGTAGRAHPDITDVPSQPLKAHPGAIGWVQHPELPK